MLHLGESVNGLSSQLVHAFISRNPTVALDPAPMNLVPLCQCVKLFPKITIFDGFTGRCPPPPCDPSVYPFRDPELYIARIGKYRHLAWPSQRFQGPNNGHQLHSIVRRQWFTARQFALSFSGQQQRTPSTGPRVTATGTIRVYLNLFSHRYAPSLHDDSFAVAISDASGERTILVSWQQQHTRLLSRLVRSSALAVLSSHRPQVVGVPK